MIDLVTTNDMHGVVKDQKAYFMNPQYPPKIVGGSGLYNYIDKLKQTTGNDLLILDGGNFFQGSNFGMHDKGLSMIEWMNMIGYDAIVPGQYDFILGINNLIGCTFILIGVIFSQLLPIYDKKFKFKN